MQSKILIVEDNELNSKMLSFYLEQNGYKTRVINNGDDVLSSCTEFMPHLVLMDIEIYGISGIEACSVLKDDPRFVKTPVFAVTALNQNRIANELQAANFDEFIEKPIILSELLEKIKTHIKG